MPQTATTTLERITLDGDGNAAKFGKGAQELIRARSIRALGNPTACMKEDVSNIEFLSRIAPRGSNYYSVGPLLNKVYHPIQFYQLRE